MKIFLHFPHQFGIFVGGVQKTRAIGSSSCWSQRPKIGGERGEEDRGGEIWNLAQNQPAGTLHIYIYVYIKTWMISKVLWPVLSNIMSYSYHLYHIYIYHLYIIKFIIFRSYITHSPTSFRPFQVAAGPLLKSSSFLVRGNAQRLSGMVQDRCWCLGCLGWDGWDGWDLNPEFMVISWWFHGDFIYLANHFMMILWWFHLIVNHVAS